MSISFEEAQANYEMILAESKRINAELAAAEELRNVLCPHTEVVAKYDYFSGSYNDQAYTDHWNECTCCGLRSQKRRENHSWYG